MPLRPVLDYSPKFNSTPVATVASGPISLQRPRLGPARQSSHQSPELGGYTLIICQRDRLCAGREAGEGTCGTALRSALSGYFPASPSQLHSGAGHESPPPEKTTRSADQALASMTPPFAFGCHPLRGRWDGLVSGVAWRGQLESLTVTPSTLSKLLAGPGTICLSHLVCSN